MHHQPRYAGDDMNKSKNDQSDCEHFGLQFGFEWLIILVLLNSLARVSWGSEYPEDSPKMCYNFIVIMEEHPAPLVFNEWLKRRRKAWDLTQDELARRAGCSVGALRKIESGERRPSKQLARLLAEH